MMILKNHTAQLMINPLGAEPVSFQAFGKEWLWNADPAFWPRHAPILFPIVGKLKGDAYSVEGKLYSLPQHGFARDKVFECLYKGIDECIFSLSDDIDTLAVYPFSFLLNLKYSLNEKEGFTVETSVSNSGEKPLLFSVGAHPGFNCPMLAGSSFEDYSLFFDTVGPWPSSTLKAGLRTGEKYLVGNGNILPLNESLFSQDALVFENFKGSKISLLYQDKPIFDFSWEGYQHLGIWKKPNAPFICLEPWNGIADGISHDGNFLLKESIITLDPNKIYTCSWTFTPYE